MLFHSALTLQKLQFQSIFKFLSLSLANNLNLAPSHRIKACLRLTKAFQTVAAQAVFSPFDLKNSQVNEMLKLHEAVQFDYLSFVAVRVIRLCIFSSLLKSKESTFPTSIPKSMSHKEKIDLLMSIFYSYFRLHLNLIFS